MEKHDHCKSTYPILTMYEWMTFFASNDDEMEVCWQKVYKYRNANPEIFDKDWHAEHVKGHKS